MNTEAKVGAFTLAALALFAFVVVELTGLRLGAAKDYPLSVTFHDVTGLRVGNLVKYAGVDIGMVESIQTDGEGATVQLKIHDGIQIPRDAAVTIGADGIMGEKFISVVPLKGGGSGGIWAAGETVEGTDQQGLEQMIASANGVLKDVQVLVASMNKMFGDERFQTSVVESAQNVKEMTGNMNQLTAVLINLTLQSESDVRSMIANFQQMSVNMNQAMARIDSMLAQVDNDGKTARDLREALANMNAASRRIENMAAAMEGVITDPKTADDLKATLQNVRNVSEKANRVMNKVSAVKIKNGVDVMYSGGADEYKVNTDTKIQFNDKDFLQLGIDDLGEENEKNLQFGTWNGKFGGRAGLIDDKAGVGLDAAFGGAFNLSVDAYDPNDFQLKLRAAYQMAPETYIIGQSDHINRSDERETFVGIRRTF